MRRLMHQGPGGGLLADAQRAAGTTSSEQIVHGGGWTTRERFGRPYARLFGFLSVMWLGITLILVMDVFGGRSSGESISWSDVLCGLAALPLPVFVVLAVVFRLRERPRVFRERIDNPDCDPRNLY